MKSLLIVSSFLVISIASLFAPSEINVTFDTPPAIITGKSFFMDIIIDKGDISDFAKLQLSLPEGFTAELLEGEEGTFTFYDQKIKLIWISLPSDPILNVKIKIGCDTSLIGDYNFTGKISYVLEGERKNKELVSPIIKINPETTTTPSTIASSKAVNNSTTEKKALSKSTELSCSRSFDATNISPGETFLVTLKVKKSNVSGVGKIIENIPDGFTAKEIENNGAIFSQQGNQVKFLWMTLPSDNEFTVSYKVMVDENQDGNKVIDGKMSYLDDEVTKNALIDGTTIEINKSSVDETETSGIEQNNKNDNSSSVEDVKSNKESTSIKALASNDIIIPSEDKTISENETSIEPEKSDKANSLDNNTASNKEDTNEEEVSNTQMRNISLSDNVEDNNTSQNETTSLVTNTGTSIEVKKTIPTDIQTDNLTGTSQSISNHKVNYRVQICALRKKTETEYFRKNHNVKEKIYLNMHEGWHKYTVGNFKEYMSARDHRRTAKSNYKINGSFVTAYNDGSRITVQEALMITKDKWIAP